MPRRIRKIPVAQPQEVVATYWTSEPGWDTELQLKNNLASGPLTVTPVLRLASGEEIALDPVTISSNASMSVWVNEGLLKHAPTLLNQPGSYGSVVFRFTSLNAMNLHADASFSMQGLPITFSVGGRPLPQSQSSLSQPWVDANKPGSLEGIWWQPRSGLKDVLAISNSSDKKVSGTLSLFDAAGKRWSQSLSLSFAPHQTLRLAPNDLAQQAGLSGSYGGIKLDVPASAPALDGVHFMYDEASKYSVSLEMFSRDPNATLQQRAGPDARQWTMRAPMLALRSPDPAAEMPAGTVLQPMIFVRNTTAKTISADIVLNWHSDSAKGQAKLPQLQLAAFATQQLQIGAMQKQLGIPDDAHWALVTLTTNALPEDLIAIASSRDISGRYGVETGFIGGSGGHFAGGEWRADATQNHIIAVTNSGQKSTDALLTLHYQDGQKKYEVEQTIQPGDQMWVNLGDLIRNRTADRKGNTLPVDVNVGTYELQELTPGSHNLMANALAVDSSLGSQVAPPHLSCCGIDDEGLNPDSFDLVIDGTDFGTVQGTNQCTGMPEDISFDFNDWWSGNTSVAMVTAKQVHGVAAGTTDAFASGFVEVGNLGYCTLIPQQVQAPVAVQVPTSLSVISYPSIPLTVAGCLATDYGMAIAITYQVLDQYGHPLQSASMEPQEKLLNEVFNGDNFGDPDPNWVDIYNPNYPGSTKYTSSTGQFLDAPFATCASEPFTETSTQPISMLLNGTNYTVRTNNWKSVTTVRGGHGTMTNGTDINASN